MAGLRQAGRRLILALIAVCVIAAAPARAQSLIRDAEIEYALAKVAEPLITAAGLSPGNVRVLVVKNSKLNAFVIDANHILIHSGLILKVERVAELQAVIAHEVAHIANGHLSRRAVNARIAGTAAKFGLLLSVAVAAASGNSEAAAGVAIGSANSARRVFFGHTRAEEASADLSALRYMSARGIDPQAMADVLDLFRGQEALSVGRQDPYVRTHPLSRDRIRAVRGYAAAYKTTVRPQPEAEYWFARAQAKLGGFLRNPGWTLRRVAANDRSDAALMRRAIAYHRVPQPDRALAQIDALIARRPNDPFLHDLKGQILLESRRTAAAVSAYARAVDLAPREALILAGYGRALLALNTAQGARRALPVLERARARDPRDPRLMRDLAVAYAKTGNRGMASLATAERYALLGRLPDAEIHAKRAVGLLPRGSAGWNRAQDVLHAAKTAG